MKKENKVEVAQLKATRAIGHFVAGGVLSGLSLTLFSMFPDTRGFTPLFIGIAGLSAVVKIIQGFIALHESQILVTHEQIVSDTKSTKD